MRIFPYYFLKYNSTLDISQIAGLLKEYIEPERLFHFQTHKPYQGFVGEKSFIARRITIIKVFPAEIKGRIFQKPEGNEITITITPFKPILLFTLFAVISSNIIFGILLAKEILLYLGNIQNYQYAILHYIAIILIAIIIQFIIYIGCLVSYIIEAGISKRDFTELFSNNQTRLLS
jgi:hypothetical protein